MEMDWAALPNNMAITNFVQACEFRGLHDGVPVCGKVAEHTGLSFGVDVQVCAQCRLHGPVDEQFVRGMSFGALMKRVSMAVMGIHKGPAYIADIAARALRLSPDEDKRAQLDIHFINLVSLGRLGIEDVKAILRQHSYHPDQHPIHAKLQAAHELREKMGFVDGGPQKCCGDKPPIVSVNPELEKRGLLDTFKSAGKAIMEHAAAANKAAQAVARFAFGGEAEKEVEGRRMHACMECPLFHKESDTIGPTCGVPFWKKMVRDEKVEGCGCVLRLKWTGAGEECPLGKW